MFTKSVTVSAYFNVFPFDLETVIVDVKKHLVSLIFWFKFKKKMITVSTNCLSIMFITIITAAGETHGFTTALLQSYNISIFFCQIRVLGMLDHPNIISYYDSFEEDGTLMIEMEYADGG